MAVEVMAQGIGSRPGPAGASEMGQDSARYGLAALILVILWIAVYWWTPAPAPEPAVSFGEVAPGRREPPAILSPAPPPASFLGPAPAAPEPAPDAAAQPARPPVPGVIPPSFRDYTVQVGDTAQSISKRFFGSPEHWRQIMKANPRVDFTRLRAGRLIRVPVDPENVQGVASKPAPDADSGSKPAADPRAGAPGTPAPTMEYRVKSGDTLSEIAQSVYGRSALWTIIRDANREQVGPEGARLRPGMTLIIPPAPASPR